MKKEGCKHCSSKGGECIEKCLPKGWNNKSESESKTFSLSEDEVKKFEAWRRTKEKKYLGAIGGGYEFRFLPTSIGTFVSAHCWDGTWINLTDYDKL
jgi:hypothetical protein